MKNLGFPGLLKKFLPLVYVLAFVLTLVVGFVGYSTSRKIHRTITQQFNEQQLILARKISDHIQNQIAHLEITLLGLRRTGELLDIHFMIKPGGILSQFLNLSAGDILAILILDEQGKIAGKIQDPRWNPGPFPLPELQSLSRLQESGYLSDRVWIGSSFLETGKWILPMGVPFQKKGGLFFIVDAIQIAQKATRGVVSGTTGYAWIINHQGIFFDHYETDFIGKNIFEVRKTKAPHFSFKKIDDLTREELLKKKEGTSTYVSGWHRSQRTVTEKLIAYTPIPFYETPDRNLRPQPRLASEFWSVALVAPTEEVSGLVRSLNFHQALLIAIFQICIIVGTGFWVFLSNRWSRYLKIEIQNKTDELKKSQEKLVQSERLASVGSMASHVSHEIKNPLLAIGGLAHQLKRSPLLGEKEKQKLELITTEINRLETMLLEIRDFSRPTTPHKRLARINQVVLEVGQLFSPLMAEQHIQYKTQYDPDLPDFLFDPEQIKQVLINLIKNAVEAMPEGGTMTLQTEEDKNSVLIRVVDTGKGIDQEIKDKLFRPFVTTKKKGTGLGLAVSYKLIQDHNGDILVDSSEKGTTMTVQLPIEE